MCAGSRRHVMADTALSKTTFIKRQVCWLGISAALMFAAYAGVLSLQSSINIAAELGTTTLAVAYSTTVAWNLFVTSALLKRIGPKKCILLGDAFFLVYTLANIWPGYPTLVPASVLLGIAQAVTWSSFPLFTGHFGRQYAAAKGADLLRPHACSEGRLRNEENYTCRFAGLFYSIESAYLVFGNLASYAILRSFQEEDPSSRGYESTGSPMPTVNATSTATPEPYPACGSSQCSFAELESPGSIERYEIQSWESRIALFLAFAFLQLLAILIHACVLRDPSSYDWVGPCVNDLNENRATVAPEGTYQKTQRAKSLQCLSGALATLRHLGNFQQLLILPFNLYHGMMMAFIFGDFTRSFVSCLSSVVQVGLVMSVLGAAEILSNFCFNWIGPKLGHTVFMAVVFTVETTTLLFCLLWKPHPDAAWASFILAFALGVPDGLRQSVITVIYVQYFQKKSEEAYSCLSLLTGVGSALMYIFSRFLCVYAKIEMLLSLLLFSGLSYILAEIRYRRERITRDVMEEIVDS